MHQDRGCFARYSDGKQITRRTICCPQKPIFVCWSETGRFDEHGPELHSSGSVIDVSKLQHFQKMCRSGVRSGCIIGLIHVASVSLRVRSRSSGKLSDQSWEHEKPE